MLLPRSARNVLAERAFPLRIPTLVGGLIVSPPEENLRGSGSLGSFCKIIFFFAARAGGMKPRQPLCGLILSDTIFRIFESRAVAGSGVLALLLGLPLVAFSRSFGCLRIR